ncbi:nucleoside deaminase [Halopseudomonas salina]|uniref:tRNA-specific adenosine deaminase n=1 Tax=Halopseudomonas salina TaxID=1323744 RepID=A0ABQ1PD10_9GAMM|nr:nucleoside deaminase [Halopseudomonas salina]GGC94766.1 tRNA-specific adenosine deaminase [Halopseudomonas salina]
MSYPLNKTIDETFLLQAVRLAVESVGKGGGPFGALVVRNGEVLAQAANRVTLDCDPTAHAEVLAIRLAASDLASPHLEDTTLYASCEPCPMCLAAAHWARIPRIVFAASQETANLAGFADGNIAEQLYGQTHPVRMQELGLSQLEVEDPGAPFLAWLVKHDRQPY